MSRRKTQAQQDEAWRDKDRRAWEYFRGRLETVKDPIEAHALVREAPSPASPGRRYYSNLGFFLMTFEVPAGSSRIERQLYLNLISRFDAVGALKSGARARIENNLRLALNQEEEM